MEEGVECLKGTAGEGLGVKPVGGGLCWAGVRPGGLRDACKAPPPDPLPPPPAAAAAAAPAKMFFVLR